MKPGERYEKNGIAIDIHEVRKGQVYYRTWPKGVENMNSLQCLFRMSIDKFTDGLKGAERTA